MRTHHGKPQYNWFVVYLGIGNEYGIVNAKNPGVVLKYYLQNIFSTPRVIFPHCTGSE